MLKMYASVPERHCRRPDSGLRRSYRKGVFTESRMAEKIWNAPQPDEIAAVFGSYDANINLIQKQFQVVIVNRNTGSAQALGTLGRMLIILAPAALLLINHLRSRKAYDDPALMERRYRAVLNRRMEATIEPVGGRTRTVVIPREQ